MPLEPVRVLHIVNSLELGGAESMLTSLVTRGARPDIAPMVVALFPGGPHGATIRDAGIEVQELGLTPSIVGLARLPAVLFRLVSIMRRFRPHVVQSWLYYADLLALFALKLAKLPPETRLIWGIRCSDMDLSRYGPLLRLALRACASLSSRPDMVIANSAAGLAVHRAIGYRPRKAAVIPNGIDIERFRPDTSARAALRQDLKLDPDTLVFAHVARFDPMKDHATMLEALNQVDGVMVLAAGSKTDLLPPHPRLLRLGARLDVPALLAASDAVISSSAFGEGFSNALAEGMSVGLVPIATDVGDAADIVGNSGIIVPPGNPAAFAAAMGSVAALSRAERLARGQAARDRIVAEFSLHQAAARFAAIYGAQSSTSQRQTHGK